MREIYVVTGPAEEPVSVEEAKTHLRIDQGDEDVWLDTAVRAVRERVERVTGRTLVTQTLEVTGDGWPAGPVLVLPRPPLVSVVSIKYTDAAGVEATLASDDYYVDTRSTPGRVVLKAGKSWPGTALREANGVGVRFVAGYGATRAAVPAEIRAGMLLALGELYENRENTAPPGGLSTIPNAAERMWLKYRVWEAW